MAFGTTRFIESEYDAPQGPAPGTVKPPITTKPYTQEPVIVERAPGYYRDPATVVITGQPQQTFQFTGTQLIIGAIVLYLLLKG